MAQAQLAVALLDLAEKAQIDTWEPEKALKAAQEALELYREIGDADGIARSLFMVSASLLRNAKSGEPTEATEFAQEHMESYKAAGDSKGEAIMKIALAESWMDRFGDKPREEALDLAKDAKAFFIAVGDKWYEAKATMTISMILIKKCDKAAGPVCAREALKYARQALIFAQEFDDRRSEAKALYLLFTCKMYSETTWRDAVKYGKEAAEIYKEIGCTWWTAVTLRTIADWAVMKGQGADGRKFAEEALDIFRQVETDDDKRGWEASCLATLVGTHASCGGSGAEKALEVALEGVEKLKASDDLLSKAQAFDVLAGAYMMQDDIVEALSAAEGSLSLYRQLGDKKCQMHVLNEISEVHLKAGDDKEAFATYQDAYAIADELGDKRAMARNLSAQLRLHLNREEIDQALREGEEALELYRSAGQKDGEGVVLLNIASAHMAKELFPQALAEVQEAKEIFQSLESKDREAQACFFMSEVFTRQEKWELALNALSEARILYARIGNKYEESSMCLVMAQCNLSAANSVFVKSDKDKDGHRRMRKLLTASLKVAKEGLAIIRKLPQKDPDLTVQGNMLSAVAQAQGLLGKHKEALKSANQAMTIATDCGNQIGECSTLMLYAQIHHWNDIHTEAVTFANKALEKASRIQDPYFKEMAIFVLEQVKGESEESHPQHRRETSEQEVSTERAAGAQSMSAEGSIGVYQGPTAEALIPKINELAMGLISGDDLDQDTPLMDSGLDSLSMVQFRNVLQQQFPGVPMPASLVFDHPSVRAVSLNIAEELMAAHAAGRALKF